MSNLSVTRRAFLQNTATAAGASLLSGSNLLRAEPVPSAAEAAPASDRVRFGIVGVGMEGTGLLTTAIQLRGVECVAAADLYDGRHELAKEITDELFEPGRFFDYRLLLNLIEQLLEKHGI